MKSFSFATVAEQLSGCSCPTDGQVVKNLFTAKLGTLVHCLS
jgi:hypothetical protein